MRLKCDLGCLDLVSRQGGPRVALRLTIVSEKPMCNLVELGAKSKARYLAPVRPHWSPRFDHEDNRLLDKM